MKYVNAHEVLPEELLAEIQKYYHGGYLYIPGTGKRTVVRKTDYQLELEKRNQSIYLKYLEGRTNVQLGAIYHLSEPSIRRIISRERKGYQRMKATIERILPLWGIEAEQVSQIYPSAWEIDHTHVIKVYRDKEQLERNIKIAAILSNCGIPVAEAVPARTGEAYVRQEDTYFFLSKKLQGQNLSDLKDEEIAGKMGAAIARLHRAFLQCEKEIPFWDNSLLKEMKGWVYDDLVKCNWQAITEPEYQKAVGQLEAGYDSLPRQLIHRDVHFGNFLFHEGSFSGYIDFDLSQKNIRIFDICYFLAGLLAEETEHPFTKEEWLRNVKAVISGYESVTELSCAEKKAIPAVMECIEILFAAYYTGMGDSRHAEDAYKVFRFIRDCESEKAFFHIQQECLHIPAVVQT